MADRAILYGINEYLSPSISNLRGCVNDIENIEDLLVDKFRFSRQNIRARADHQVTLGRIAEDWRWLVEDARPGDRLVFHFSGHGSQVTDHNGDEDDGVDEILCLYDMDFEAADTYLIDDQIHEWTERLPDGVKLTFILDCCHSGTGTRALRPSSDQQDRSIRTLPLVMKRETKQRKQRSDIRQAARSFRSIASEDEGEHTGDPDIVLARYVTPPRQVQKRMKTFGTRSTLGRQLTNHVRLSGCKDAQTSADAYIDGEFQGAFSAYFCQAVENEGSNISHRDALASVGTSLRNADFRQTPQLNPKQLDTKLFEGIGNRDNDEDVRDDTNGDDLEDICSTDLRQLISKVDELVDAVADLASDTGGRRDSKDRGQLSDRVIVYVHGICWHNQDFSKSWFKAMRRHLPSDLRQQLERNRKEVLWSRHVSSGPRGEQASRSAEEQRLANEITDVLHDRVAQSMELQMGTTSPGQSRSTLNSRNIDRALFGIPGVDCVDDFVKYLASDRTRQKVLDEFIRVVKPLLEAKKRIELVSHSWGTVVALEALHQLDRETNALDLINNFFTVGSALSIRMIQRRLKFGAEHGDKPRLVKNWYNLDARGDIVGGTLRGLPFEVDEEYLNLDPTGCDANFFGPSPSCAHSSYFRRVNVGVNRDIFARHLS